MVNRIKNVKENFDIFYNLKYKKNEYFIKGKEVGYKERLLPIWKFNTLEVEKLQDYILPPTDCEERHVISIIHDFALTRFHPNNINNKEFWNESRSVFPYFSVTCAESKSIKEVNRHTNTIPERAGFIEILNTFINTYPQKLNFLEIGFGYGNIFEKYKNSFNYIGIDYIIPKFLKHHKNFIEIDKSGIPEYLLNENLFDIVYSVNVLQHCSQKDRFEYIKQAYDALKTGGYFFMTVNLLTPSNKNEPCWSFKDKNGRCYTHFLNQFTEVDTETELIEGFKSIGFKIKKAMMGGYNFAGFVLQK